jgi:ribosomal protein S30
MLRPKLDPKPKQKFSPRQNNYNDPQLEIRIQSTTTRGSVSSTRDWNITHEGAQRMIPQDSSKLG